MNTFVLEVNDLRQLQAVMQAIRKVDGVVGVERVKSSRQMPMDDSWIGDQARASNRRGARFDCDSKRSGGLLDLAGAEAAGADVDVAGRPVDHGADPLNVGEAPLVRDVVRVADLGAELRALPADLTSRGRHTDHSPFDSASPKVSASGGRSGLQLWMSPNDGAGLY